MTLMIHNKRSYYAGWWFYNNICLMVIFIFLILATKIVDKNLKTLMLMKSACFWDVTVLQGVRRLCHPGGRGGVSIR